MRRATRLGLGACRSRLSTVSKTGELCSTGFLPSLHSLRYNPRRMTNIVNPVAGRSVLVVGGAGFVGRSIIARLLDLGCDVSCMDMVDMEGDVKDSCCHNFTGHITDLSFVMESFRAAQPNVVIHLASFGMSGGDMLDPACFNINVLGTNNIITACIDMNVKMLVYTSSYNVVFGGQEIFNGKEDRMQYYPREMAVDHYGPTKALAEQAVIRANGSRGRDGVSVLRTCSLRPAAIYGEHERRHFTRIVKHIDSGAFVFRIGSAIVDWVYIDNLVDAYVLVIKQHEACGPYGGSFGQCYAISDGTPIENFELLRPICVARRCDFPQLVIPTALAICLAWFCENMFLLLELFGISSSPFLTRSEVHKVGVTHYFSIDKARAELGYNPQVSTEEGIRRVAKFYKESISNENFFRMAHPIWWLLCDGGMLLTYYYAHTAADEILPILLPLYLFSMVVCRTQQVLKYVFVAATLAHLAEGVYAFVLAGRKGCSQSRQLMWFLQTLCLGYPSLSILQERPEYS